MNQPEQTEENTMKLCPVDGAICDRKCGYIAHGTITRKKVAITIPEDPNDAMLCEGCQ